MENMNNPKISNYDKSNYVKKRVFVLRFSPKYHFRFLRCSPKMKKSNFEIFPPNGFTFEDCSAGFTTIIKFAGPSAQRRVGIPCGWPNGQRVLFSIDPGGPSRPETWRRRRPEVTLSTLWRSTSRFSDLFDPSGRCPKMMFWGHRPKTSKIK